MTNLEGRVLRRRRALPPPARGPRRPADAGALAGRLGRGRYFSRRPARRCSTSCGGPAPAGSPTTPASATSGSRRSRACSGRARPTDHPARRGCSPTASRPPTAGPASSRSSTATRARPPDARVPVRADHRPDHAAVPERHPDPAGAAARPGPVPARRTRCTPTWPAGSASRTATWSSCAPAAGGRSSGPRSTTDIRPDTVFVPVPLGRRLGRQPLTNPALDPHSRMPAFKACAVDLPRVGGPDDDHLLAPARPARNQSGLQPDAPR